MQQINDVVILYHLSSFKLWLKSTKSISSAKELHIYSVLQKYAIRLRIQMTNEAATPPRAQYPQMSVLLRIKPNCN